MRAAFQAQAERWRRLLPRAADLDISFRTSPPDEVHVEHGTNLMLGQALHHGDDHRTHVCTILGAHGRTVPDLDMWSFWDARRAPLV